MKVSSWLQKVIAACGVCMLILALGVSTIHAHGCSDVWCTTGNCQQLNPDIGSGCLLGDCWGSGCYGAGGSACRCGVSPINPFVCSCQ